MEKKEKILDKVKASRKGEREANKYISGRIKSKIHKDKSKYSRKKKHKNNDRY